MKTQNKMTLENFNITGDGNNITGDFIELRFRPLRYYITYLKWKLIKWKLIK